jgi:hypothetical protein
MVPVPTECVLCDWRFDLSAAVLAAFRPGERLPLCWDGVGVRQVRPYENIAETVPSVALAAHWATGHPDQLRGLVGDFDLSEQLVRPGA